MANTPSVFQSIVTVDAVVLAPVVTVYQSIVTIDVGESLIPLTTIRPFPFPIPYECCTDYLDNTGAVRNRFPMR